MGKMRNGISVGVCAAAIATFFWAGGVFAQAAPADAPGAKEGLDDIVVVARKVSENVQNVPISITAFSGETLKQQSVKDMYDLQSQIPNLVIQKGQIDGQALFVSIRGQVQNDVTANLDSAVGIYFDGIYYPRTIGLAGQLLDIQRVEVLRGPQGTLYGRNTTGGALSVFTKNPTDHLGASVELTEGSFNYFNGVGIINVPMTERLSARFVVQRGRSGGYGQDAAGHNRGDENSLTLRGKIRADIGNGGEAVLTGSFARNRTGGGVYHLSGVLPSAGNLMVTQVARQSGLGTTAAGLAATRALLQTYIDGDRYTSNNTVPQFSNFRSHTVALDVKLPVSDTIDVRSLSGYQTPRRETSLGIGEVPFTIVKGRQDNDSYYLSQEFQLLGNSERLKWVLGAYAGYEHALETSDTTLVPNVVAVNPRHIGGLLKNGNLSAFAQASWAFGDGWSLTGGFRYSHDTRKAAINNTQGVVCTVPAPGVTVTPPGASQCGREFKVSFSKPSWLASLDRKLSDRILAYAKVSRGYRSGGLNYRGANSVDTFAAFAPEIVTEYEAGLKTSFFDHHVQFNLAAFHDDYKNIQRTATIIGRVSGISTSIITNAARGEINGFEAEMRIKAGNGLTLGTSVGMTDAKYKKFIDLTGDRTHEKFPTPRWKGGVNAAYVQPLDIGRLTLTANYQWQSYVNLQPVALIPDAVSQKAYGLLDARIALTLADWDADIAVYGKNLTDKAYRATAVGNDQSLGFDVESMGPPRSFGITLTKRFGVI